jgi:microcystin degradation protein MlrC
MSKKILVFRFYHETNAFCPAPADMAAFEKMQVRIGEEMFRAVRGTRADVGGILSVLEEEGHDFELIPVIGMGACPSGPVTGDVYQFCMDHIRHALEEKGPVDAIMIAFHGAMVAEGHPDAEGDVLETLRSWVGGEIPIVAGLDLHTNLTAKMCRYATALVCYEGYPHTDIYETYQVAARLLADTLEGKIRPVMAYRRIPFLQPLFPTARPEIRPLYDLAHHLEARPGVLTVRFAHGFFASDIEEMGMSVLVVTDNDRALAESTADELAAAIDRDKEKLREEYPTLDEALDLALQPGEGPVVIADTSDNPGGGGLGDTTHILRRVLERGMTGGAFACILDPQSVLACEKAGVGNTVDLQLGGMSDPAVSGGPLPVRAFVRAITCGEYRNKGLMGRGSLVRCGKTAVLEIGGNYVLVTSYNTQPLDLEVYRSNGITPEDQKFLVVKSAIHFRASFGTIARTMVAVPLPGYIPPTPEHFRYRNWKGSV